MNIFTLFCEERAQSSRLNQLTILKKSSTHTHTHTHTSLFLLISFDFYHAIRDRETQLSCAMSASWDGRLCLWDVQTGLLHGSLNVGEQKMYNV